MASFYSSSVREFLRQSDGETIATLEIGYAQRGFTRHFTDQTLTWERDLRHLRSVLEECVRTSPSAADWGLLMEFSIPLKEARIDVVLLVRSWIILLEAKSGEVDSAAKKQAEQYGLLLHYFHKASDQRHILPVAVSTQAAEESPTEWRQQGMFPQLASYWVKPVLACKWEVLARLLLSCEDASEPQVSCQEWNNSPYFPVPSIIEAALELRSGLSIAEIAHSEAAEHEIQHVRDTIQNCLRAARDEGQHAICFLTGVPGSGKTLVGLSLAHLSENKTDAVHFMSGNGPLVKVMQHLLTREGMRKGARKEDAEREAKTLLGNIHVFARYHEEDNRGAPSNHAIVFDEAQRAWNSAQNNKKFQRDYSEPAMLLRIMERHPDWAFVVALVGGGQEINDGEAGLEEWGRALAERATPWKVYASPEVMTGGPSTAGHRLFEDGAGLATLELSDALHLRTSNRSLRGERIARWVDLVLQGEATAAAELNVAESFPIFLSRNLEQTRAFLRQQTRGEGRCGLIGSSGATRLRAEGLEPSSTFHADYAWQHWYLADRADIRSSYQCEVFATEFEVQGLELDWIGVCWGGDFIWDGSAGWRLRALRYGSRCRWNELRNSEKRRFKSNAYRVLLTRARQGMVLFIPRGSAEDSTCALEEFEQTANFLLRCGVTLLPSE